MKQWTLNMSKYHRGILDSKKGLQCMMLCIALLAPSYATANVGNEQKSFYEVTQPLSMMKETSNVSPIDNSVRGTIIDEKGVPLPGVSVAIKGTSTGVISDINGYYIINAKAGDILVFSFVGFKSQEITVGKRPALDIVMKEDVHELEETVIVGMGKQRKASVIGSISSVSIKELEVPQRNLTNALSGRIAGAVVVQRSGEPGQDNADFWVRGISSFGANQKPLVLVDGVERDMSDLSIEEVESISILKDASATAIYGSRAKEGAIIITLMTKEEYQAKQNEKTLGDKIDALQNKLNSNDVKKVSYFLDDKEVSDTELQTLRQNKASEYDVVTVETDGKPAVKIKTKPVSNITIRGLKGTVKSVNGTPVFPDTSDNENRVAGKVCDTDGNPVIGACVLVEGTTIGTVTDLNGTFKLETLKGSVLSVSYIDMQTAKVKVEDAGPLIITLKAD